MQKTEDSETINSEIAIYSCSNRSDLARFEDLLNQKKPIVLDTIESQVQDLLTCLFPVDFFSKTPYHLILEKWLQGKDLKNYGNWIYFPWKNTVVRLLEEEDFITCRTNRNQLKIKASEQQALRTKKILFVGLSVGQSAALTFAMQRIGGTYYLADFDNLSVSNMNRVRASVIDLNLPKTTIAARAISELDPYLKVICIHEGAQDDNVENIMTQNGTENLDLIVEECDSLDMKFKVREIAQKLKIPVIMETSDRGMLDIERFDKESDLPIFHGLTGDLKSESVKTIDQKTKFEVLQKLVDYTQISDSLRLSYASMGKELISWPQLAYEVALGGATLAFSAEKILLDKPLNSGRYYIDLNTILQP